MRQPAPAPAQAQAAEPESRGALRGVADVGLELGSGAIKGVKFMSDALGADNPVSGALADVNNYVKSLQSAQAKGEDQKIAAIMKEAEDKGVWEQVKAAFSGAGEAPIRQSVGALATGLPIMAASMIPGVREASWGARLATMGSLGAAQGAGIVKSTIYDEVKQRALQEGKSETEAQALASKAQAYSGENFDQIAMGAGLNAAASMTGFQPAVVKAVSGEAGKGAARGLIGSTALGVLKEVPFEAAQGGQEQVAGNVAQDRAGFATPTFRGAVGAMTMEGLLAAPGGAVGGALDYAAPAQLPAPIKTPEQAAADTIRATEKVPESGALTKAVNAGVEAKAQAVEAGAPVPTQPGAEQVSEAAPEAVDDPVRDQILSLPEGARQDALRAYAVLNRPDAAKGVLQLNRKLLDRLLTENAPPPVLGERLTETDMGTMLGGGGLAGNADPLMGALGMGREAQANSITNVANMAELRPPMPASDAARMLDEARNRGLDLAVAEHPAGGFVLVPPNWVTPDMAAQGEARLNETIARMQQADAAPVERAPRTRTDGVGLNLQTDPVQNYLDNLRGVNTPAARAYVRDFDAGRITPADVQQRMTAEQGKTPDQRIAQAAAEAPSQTDPVADRLARAAAQGAAVPAPTDILNPVGLPFKTRMAADRAAKQTPGAVVPVEGGFVVRPQEPVNVQDVPQAPEVPQAAPAVSPPGQAPQAVGAQPAGPAAGVPAEGAGAVEAAGLNRPKSTRKAAAFDARKAAEIEAGELGAQEAEAAGVPTQVTWLAHRKWVYSQAPRMTLREFQVALKGRHGMSGPEIEAYYKSSSGGAEVSAAKITTEGTANVPQADQAQQTATQPTQAGAAQPTQGLTDAAADQNPGAQAAPATGTQGAAQAATKGVAETPKPLFSDPRTGMPIVVPNKATADAMARSKQLAGKAVVRKATPAELADQRNTFAGYNPGEDRRMGYVLEVPQQEAPPAQEATYNGTRIYPTKTKVGDEVKSMWAVESPDNQRRRAAGERTIGGDSLHDTIEQAKAAAEREAKRDAEQRAAKAEQDAADKARLDAEEARKAANRPKTLMEHRKDAVLSKQVLDSETGNVMTRREWVENKVSDGLKTSITQEDKIKPMSRRQIFRADNRQQAEHDRKVKEAGKKDVYWLGDFEVTKIEYDYAQELKAQREAAQQAEAAPEPATKQGLNQPETPASKAPAATENVAISSNGQDEKAIRYELPPEKYAQQQGDESWMAAQSPSFKPTARQQLLMDAVAKALDDGAFYNSDVDEHVAKALGVTLEQRARNSRGVEGGDFGYDVYNASRAVQAQRSNAKSREFAKALNLKPGDVLGTLVFNDGKVTTGVKVNGLNDSGLVVTVTGKRGAATLNGEVGIDRLAAAMDSAKERGKRKDGYAEFVAGRGAVQQSQPAPATHADPGQAPEAATPGVVTDSLKKAARNEDTKPSEMRKWLVAEIDKELLQAADRPDYDEAVKRLGEKDAISMFTGNGPLGKNNETGYITFDVPGDGKYKVRNSVRGLLEFRKNVMASQGFKDSGQKRVKPEQNDGVQGGSGGNMAAITNMIEEGDFEAARDYAEAVGVSLDDVKVPKGERKTEWEMFRKTGFVPRLPDTRPQPAPKTAAQLDEEKQQAAEAEAKKPKDTGWNMAGTGFGGKRYIGRNITLDDGREVVARVYENAGTYEEAEVKVDGVRKFTVTDRDNAQGKADAFIRTLQDGDQAAGSAKSPTRVTPQISGNPEKFIKVAADSVRELRSVDVDRVLTETPVQFRAEVASYIRDQRKDLADEVDDVMADIQPKAAALAPAPSIPAGPRRDPAKVSMFAPYEDGDIVTINGQDWTVKQDTPGWYLTTTGNWRGQHPTIRNVKAMADLIRAVEQAAVAQPATTQPEAPKLTAEQRKVLDDSLRAGAMSVEDYMKATGLTDEDVGTFQPDGLRAQAEQKARAANPYYQLTNKIQDALSDQMKSAMDAASSTPQQRKSKEERIARITRDRSTLDMLTRKFEHPFNNNYVSKLSPILKSRFNKQFEGVKTGEFAKAEFNNASYQAWAELLIEAAGKKAVADGFVEATAAKPAAAAKPAPAAPTGATISDFGQKIGGARKDVWSGFKDDLNKVLDDDIAGQPLAKVWPAPDYQKLIDAGMNAKAVAAVRALRDEVPAKPRAAWKVKRWAEQVKTLRSLANDVMDGKITVQDMERMGANKGTNLRGMMGRIELYELVGHGKSLEGVRFAEHHYTLYRGRENVNLWVVEKDAGASAFSNWPREIAIGDTKEQALAAFREKYDSLDLQNAVRKASFDIFSERGSNAFYVGKKIGRNYAKLEGPFNTVREAREYREKNLAALEAKLEKYKEIPRERADVNQPRVGVDMRNGQDVTPQMFGEVFGFRGVEFGNWVEQKRRQKDLNDAFDALMDMAAVLDIPPKAISLNGQLGLAFGARGSGGVNPAAAHYEPDNVVINLTKKEGAGSLGHEWWHALDNYFAKQRKVNRGSFMTTGTDVGLAARGKDYYYEGGIRQEMIDAFGAVVKAINQTAMKARASTLDGKRTKDYWTTGEEMSARAFESYLISKLQDQNASNDYLANVVSEKTWDAMAALGMENENSYPYPTAAEIPAIRAGFDHFFQTVETRETEGGNVAMFRSIRTAKSAQTKLSQDAVEKAVASALNRVVGAPKVQVVAAPADAGIDVPPGVIPKGVTLPDGSVLIFSDSAESVLDVFQTVFHELYHRGSKVRFTSNPDYITKMLEIASKDEPVQQEVNAWKNTADGKDKWAEFQERGPMTGERLANFEALAVEEALATMAEKVAMGEVRKPETVIKQMARFIAKVANAWGMNRFALWLNTRSLAESEKFIIETIGMSGGKANEFTNSVLFRSKAEDISARVGDTLKSITVANVKKRAGFKFKDYLGLGLQTLGRRQIVDIYSDLLPLAEYNRLVTQMEADKNEGGAEADQLVTRWAKLDDEAKLADLMHDATLAQIDPDKPYADGDDKGKFLMLERKFKLLSDEAKAVYRDTRDAYKAHHAKVRSAIKERIERSEIKGERKAALLKQMDDEFFAAVKGVYFPLARFGQYAVTVKGPDGKVESVSRAEGKAEAEALRNNLLSVFPRDKGFTVGRVMLSKEFVASRDAVGRGFMTELYQVLDKQDMDAVQRAELEDTLGQLYLSSLPDLSWAKHGIHRKGTPGFSQDARRAFAQNMFHGARYLAKLRYSDLMQDELAAMQKHVDDWREVEDFDQNSAQRVVTEMYHRHESLMNPKSNKLSTWATSLGFVFHLGLSPASAMVNLSQTALVAYPIMGAKWGFGKASAALLKASAEAAKGKNDITGSLNADERAAYDEAVRAGTIDVTMAHDLAGIAQGEDAGVMWKIRPVMRYASFLFHHAERFNRQVTFVAAYRLAREAGADQKAAFEQATKATYDGHFDYSAANKARIMQGNVAKVLLLFKQYGQNMVYTLARNAQQAMKAETPEARAQARKALGGLLAMHAAAAGVLGLPMVTTLLAAASMIGGDDDEPWDAKVALQNMLADTFGQKPAEVLAHGLSRLTPWDISGRVGLDRLIFPDVQEGLEGQRLWESAATQALGPVGGIFGGALKGLDLISDGHYKLGLEAMLPAVLRQGVKSIRYAVDGAQDKTGVVIKDEVSMPAVVGQLLGFSPSEVRLAQEGKSAIFQQDKALAGRRQELLTKAARATMAKDAEARAEAMKEIQRFNQKNPTRRITPLNVLQSVRNRQKRIDQAEGGVYLPKNRRDAIQAGRFALAESE